MALPRFRRWFAWHRRAPQPPARLRAEKKCGPATKTRLPGHTGVPRVLPWLRIPLQWDFPWRRCMIIAKDGPMSFYSSCRALPRRFRLVLCSFMQHDGLPFAEVLPEETIERAFADADAEFAKYDDDVYT